MIYYFINFIQIVLCILMIVSMCKIFQKANEGWWKVFVPFYGKYTEFKIAGKKKWFWPQLAATIISFIFLVISSVFPNSSLAKNVQATEVGWKVLDFLLLSMVFLLIPSFVLGIIKSIGLARSFNLGGGFAVGLILLPFIFYPILAFGSSQYIGPNNQYQNPYGGNYNINQYSQNYYNNQYPSQYQQPYYQNQYNSYNQYSQQNQYTENTNIGNDINKTPNE